MADPPQSRWTVETVLAHVQALREADDRRYEQRFSEQKDAVNTAFAAQKEATSAALLAADRAVQKAEAASEKRFESVNEFRATLTDQQRTFIPRAEVDVIVRGVEEKINNLTKLMDESRQRETNSRAERRGVQGGWGYAVGVIGFIATLAALFGMLGR